MTFKLNEKGLWEQIKPIYGDNVFHQEGLVKAMNGIELLFRKAQQDNEIGFIQSLLRYRTDQGPGWDSLSNLRDVCESFEKIRNKIIHNKSHAHMHLFIYGLIVEASEPYEVLANMLNAIESKKYSIDNFPAQSPSQKIDQLISRAKKNRINLSFLKEHTDSKLRNAIFHSDYSIYGKSVRITRPNAIEYSTDHILRLLNQAKAYIEVFFKVYDTYQNKYNEPKIIDFSEGILQTNSGEPITSAKLIIRKGRGLIGIKDNWTKVEIQKGYKSWRMGHFYPYEIRLIEKGHVIMPISRRDRINNFLTFLPDSVGAFLVKKIEKIKWFDNFT